MHAGLLFFCMFMSTCKISVGLSQEDTAKLEANVKQLKEWDYVNLFKYFDKSNRNEIENDVTKIIKLVEDQKFTDIDDSFAKWFNQVFDSFVQVKNNINSGYTFNEETNTWEKSITVTGTETETKTDLSDETISELESYLKTLKEINYKILLKYLQQNERQKVETDVEKIVIAIENKQYKKIDKNTVEWFKKIVKHLININRHLTDGYIYDESTNTWTKTITTTETTINEKSIIDLEKMIEELEKWNFREITIKLEEPDREKAEPVITKMITLLKNRQHKEITPDFVTEFVRIYRLLREARPIVVTEIVTKVREIENVDWEKILTQIEGIDQNIWKERIRQVIEEAKTRPDGQIEHPWLNELRRIIYVIRKETKPMNPIKLRRFNERIRYLIDVNWISVLQQIRGIDHQLWSQRFQEVINHFQQNPDTRMTFPWMRKMRRIIRIMYNRLHTARPNIPCRKFHPIYFTRVRPFGRITLFPFQHFQVWRKFRHGKRSFKHGRGYIHGGGHIHGLLGTNWGRGHFHGGRCGAKFWGAARFKRGRRCGGCRRD